MTIELNGADHFELLLQEVLYETANPQPPLHIESRIHAALSLQPVPERGPAMVNSAPVLQSQSILWDGPSASPWNVRGLVGAAFIHALAIFLIVFAILHRTQLVASVHTPQVAILTVPPLPPIAPRTLAAGGGGGNVSSTPVTRGNPPKVAPIQIMPVKAPPLEQPRIALEPTVVAQADLKMAHSDVPQIGMPNSPLVGMSFGNGRGTGLGSGDGAGIGPGSGGNTGGGIERIGGGVSAPIVTFQPEPEFSDEARKAKVGGNVLVYLQVDESGHPINVRVLRGIGMGLDQRAVAAVQQYRFRPAMKDGHPVRIEMNVEVNFSIF
ncbi:energy transducer TonB [Granulicella tundricola]|uniref:TonB family protein n=1 Tax=Granulicella tundricola (strain ATCC BAA-1859 / DSM 23138 / MP5ACTX9) TaxID=1198114 RepID=E8WWS2_GRATM|nr:energy transducer TonB [Granulicella tundricola]ADW67400.1 TonB family protein [Granulicella tundricola MP5ACTX9]